MKLRRKGIDKVRHSVQGRYYRGSGVLIWLASKRDDTMRQHAFDERCEWCSGHMGHSEALHRESVADPFWPYRRFVESLRWEMQDVQMVALRKTPEIHTRTVKVQVA